MTNFYFFKSGLVLSETAEMIVHNLDRSKKQDVLTALDISIEKWEVLYYFKLANLRENVHSGWGNTCALCLITKEDEECGSELYSCPIFEFTNRDQCGGTPHHSAVYELTSNPETIHTKHMLDFLIEVRDWYKKEKLNE